MRPWIATASLLIASLPFLAVLVFRWDWLHLSLLAVTLTALIGAADTIASVSAAIVRNLTARQGLATLAHLDQLTGLPNRLTLQSHLHEALEATADEKQIAVHFVDLDHFKAANDTYGHAVGDLLLAAVAKRLSEVLRPTDFAARWGGDEFVVVQSRLTDATEAEFLARRIIRTLSEPYSIDRHTIRIGATVGIAIAPENGTSSASLLDASDSALYRAKRQTRGSVQIFDRTAS